MKKYNGCKVIWEAAEPKSKRTKYCSAGLGILFRKSMAVTKDDAYSTIQIQFNAL